MKKHTKTKHSDVGLDIIEGLEAAVDYKKGKKVLSVSELNLPKPAPIWTKSKIVRLRKKVMGVSQTAFASYLNVSPETVKKWEQGQNQPEGASARLLQLINKNPKAFVEQVGR